MPLRRVTHQGFYRRGRAEWRGLRILDDLVVLVVAPPSRLVGAECAVAHCVVAIQFVGQSEVLQVQVGLCFGQSVQIVIPVAGRSQITVDLRDVACNVVLVFCNVNSSVGL